MTGSSPSSIDRITPDKRLIAVVVYATACLQVIGFCGKTWAQAQPTAFAQVLNQVLTLTPSALALSDHIYLGLMIFGIVWAFFRWSPWPFGLIGLLFLIDAAAKTFMGYSLAAEFALPADCSHYLWFLAIGYALRNARTLDIEVGLPGVRALLRLGLSLSFITLGLLGFLAPAAAFEAPRLAAMSGVFGIDPTIFRAFLSTVNVLAGFCAFLIGGRTILLYLAGWGLLSALFTHLLPKPDSFEILLQAPLYMLPLLIFAMQAWVKRGAKKPYAHRWKRLFSHWA